MFWLICYYAIFCNNGAVIIMNKSILGIPIIVLLLVCCFSISAAEEKIEKTTYKNILYVGGSGPGNYSFIQDAINNSENESVVFVYNGIYYEHICINKSISLIGENNINTIIDGSRVGHAVIVTAENVKISNFKIRNSGPKEWDAAVRVMANNSTIENNILVDNTDAISLIPSSHSKIINNQIKGGLAGIDVYGLGVDAVDNIIKGNILENITYAIWLGFAYNTLVEQNHFNENKYAIMMEDSKDNLFTMNNFVGNDLNAYFTNISKNKWKINYWDRGRVLPYIIFGAKTTSLFNIPMFNIDWSPALKPYDI